MPKLVQMDPGAPLNALSAYAFTDYKIYLNKKLDDLDEGGRGARARMSRAIGCQTAYTARVLRGDAQFSLEHAEGINDFLGHNEGQGHYFILLVQFDLPPAIRTS